MNRLLIFSTLFVVTFTVIDADLLQDPLGGNDPGQQGWANRPVRFPGQNTDKISLADLFSDEDGGDDEDNFRVAPYDAPSSNQDEDDDLEGRQYFGFPAVHRRVVRRRRVIYPGAFDEADEDSGNVKGLLEKIYRLPGPGRRLGNDEDEDRSEDWDDEDNLEVGLPGKPRRHYTPGDYLGRAPAGTDVSRPGTSPVLIIPSGGAQMGQPGALGQPNRDELDEDVGPSDDWYSRRRRRYSRSSRYLRWILRRLGRRYRYRRNPWWFRDE